ncbi:MAG: hypothetical protein JXA79_03235 [Deltaproteobacteria bacterium]|nr:hypothetical protein [Deltaproteobacteria bacterium]
MIKKIIFLKMVLTTIILLAIACSMTYAEPIITQTFTLNPGWNSVFLEIAPLEGQRDPNTVFQGLPQGTSVWTFIEQSSHVEFLTNPEEGLIGVPGWLAYFNAEQDACLNTLYAVLGKRAYLINLSGEDDVTLAITGIPVVTDLKWTTDSFNLTGFHLSKEGPNPTFYDFFAPSGAHRGQAMYRLNNQGRWEFIDAPKSAFMKSGEAYWIYCQGASTYQGPLNIELNRIDGFNFGTILQNQIIDLQNLSSFSRSLTFSLDAPGVVMTYRRLNKEGYFEWPPIGEMPAYTLAAAGNSGEGKRVYLGVRRELMDKGVSEGILTISDNKGVRMWVPVIVEKYE